MKFNYDKIPDGKNDDDLQAIREFVNGNNVAVTTYFISWIDPQRGVFAPKDRLSYIEKWYNSIHKLNMKGIVFYDDLSDGFTFEHTSENVIFVKVNLGNWSLNDERFRIYKRLLEQATPDKILFTDSSDLFFNKNPFDFMEDDKIYLGTDNFRTPRIENNAWCLTKLDQLSKQAEILLDADNDIRKMQVFNAGTIGGEYTEMLPLISGIYDVLKSANTRDNNNMMAYNYVIWRDYEYGTSDKIFAGEPFTNQFTSMKFNTKTHYIVHK